MDAHGPRTPSLVGGDADNVARDAAASTQSQPTSDSDVEEKPAEAEKVTETNLQVLAALTLEVDDASPADDDGGEVRISPAPSFSSWAHAWPPQDAEDVLRNITGLWKEARCVWLVHAYGPTVHCPLSTVHTV